MRKSTTPKGGSILAYIVTQGRLRCTCQPCAIESITPMGLGHTVLFGAIECAIGWGMETPCGWRGLSNVQCDGVMAHHVVWWRWVGAVPVCPPERPRSGVSIPKIHALCAGMNDGCAPAGRHGRAHRHRPYQTPLYIRIQSSPTTSTTQTKRVNNPHTHRGGNASRTPAPIT